MSKIDKDHLMSTFQPRIEAVIDANSGFIKYLKIIHAIFSQIKLFLDLCIFY